MGLINDPEMCVVCETRNCQHPRHHEPPQGGTQQTEN